MCRVWFIPIKIGWGCVARLRKPVLYFRPKSVIYPILFQPWPKLRYPIWDQFHEHGWCNHKLRKAFVTLLFMVFSSIDEEVASKGWRTAWKERYITKKHIVYSVYSYLCNNLLVEEQIKKRLTKIIICTSAMEQSIQTKAENNRESIKQPWKSLPLGFPGAPQ